MPYIFLSFFWVKIRPGHVLDKWALFLSSWPGCYSLVYIQNIKSYLSRLSKCPVCSSGWVYKRTCKWTPVFSVCTEVVFVLLLHTPHDFSSGSKMLSFSYFCEQRWECFNIGFVILQWWSLKNQPNSDLSGSHWSVFSTTILPLKTERSWCSRSDLFNRRCVVLCCNLIFRNVKISLNSSVAWWYI